MENKRYDIVCKKARKRIKGIDCILDMVDAENSWPFHDSVIERFEFDADRELLIVDIASRYASCGVQLTAFRNQLS